MRQYRIMRASAAAREQEMQAAVVENRAKVVEAEAAVPMAIADAFRNGRLGVMDWTGCPARPAFALGKVRSQNAYIQLTRISPTFICPLSRVRMEERKERAALARDRRRCQRQDSE
jgi:hypothetical protein